jgi:hypothetical protein
MISIEKGLLLEGILAQLKEHGIEAKPTDTIKDIAAKAGKTPVDIFNLIEVK